MACGGVPHPQVTAFRQWGGEGIGAEGDEEGGRSERSVSCTESAEAEGINV
jgi:hypothetical protein